MARYNGFLALAPMKSKYTVKDWEAREEEYINVIGSLVTPFEPDEKDICSLNAAIDQVYSIAKIEQAVYTRLYERMYQKRKNSESHVYLIVKKNIPPDKKTTESEIKALGIEFLLNEKVDNGNYNIYELVDMAMDRKCFMDGVIDTLKQKSDKLITDSGALKLAIQIQGNKSASA